MGNRLTERALAITAVAIAALCTLPSTTLWHFPSAALNPAWTLALVIGVAILAPELEGWLERQSIPPWPWRSWPLWAQRALLAGAVLSITISFFVLAADRDFGDAERIVAFVRQGAWFHKRAPLSIASFQLIHHVVGDARTAIQLVSAIAGGIAVWATLRFATLLTPDRPALQSAVVASILSVGAVVLFFGHVEHYALPAALAMAFVTLGSRSLQNDGSVVPAAATATLAAAVHLSMLTLMPALAYLCWIRCVRDRSLRSALPQLALTATVTLLPAILLFVLMREVGYLRAREVGFGGGDATMFVPLFEKTGMAQYLFLRRSHLGAIANQQLLTAPVALVACLLFGLPQVATWVRRRAPIEPAAAFVGLAALGFFSLTVIWNPDLGPLRDWSLFAPAGLLLSMLAAMLIVDRREPARAFACLVVIATTSLHRTLPWLLYNLGI